MTKLKIYTDGGARGNPGPSATGFIIKSESGEIIAKIGRKIGEATNNIAEYQAVIDALIYIRDKKLFLNNSLEFFLDSRLVVNQVNGLFKIKNSNLRLLLMKIRQLEKEAGGGINYRLVSREENREADRMVNQALDRQ